MIPVSIFEYFIIFEYSYSENIPGKLKLYNVE